MARPGLNAALLFSSLVGGGGGERRPKIGQCPRIRRKARGISVRLASHAREISLGNWKWKTSEDIILSKRLREYPPPRITTGSHQNTPNTDRTGHRADAVALSGYGDTDFLK